MQVGCVSLGPSASPVPALPVSPAQLPCAEAWFLSLAPMPSFPFTARSGWGGEVPRENPCPHQEERGVGLKAESAGSGARLSGLLLPASQAQARRVTSSLKNEWLEAAEKVVRGTKLQPVAKSGLALPAPTVCRNSVSVLLGSSGPFLSGQRPPLIPSRQGVKATSVILAASV